MFTKDFWRGAAERAIKSGAQFALLTLGVGAVAGGVDGQTADVINAFTINFVTLGGAFLGGGLLSVLTSLTIPGPVPDGTGRRRATAGHDQPATFNLEGRDLSQAVQHADKRHNGR